MFDSGDAVHASDSHPSYSATASPDTQRLQQFLDRLDPQQLEAAVSPATHLRILAGAGSGKTQALIGRACAYILAGNSASSLTLLSFTRRSARQLVTRCTVAHERPRGGTFHSLAHDDLRRFGGLIGLVEDFSVLDPEDVSDIVAACRSDVMATKQHRRRFPRGATISAVYSHAVNTGGSIRESLAEVAPWAQPFEEDVVAICRAYSDHKRRIGGLDFDDLLLYWHELLVSRHGERVCNRTSMLLIDEYQDVNHVQVGIARAFAQSGSRVTVVGDDAQAIYSFRGSSPRYILDFEDDFPGAQTVILSTSYRCRQPILDLANAVASEARTGFSVRLESAHAGATGLGTAPPASPVELLRCYDDDSEARYLCQRILDHRDQGTPLREQAVLVRAHHHSAELEIVLTEHGIPYVKYGGLRYLEAAHVKDVLAAFRAADNRADELAWFRLLQLLPGVGPATARRASGALPTADWPSVVSDLPASSRTLASGLLSAILPAGDLPVSVHADHIVRAYEPLLAENYDKPEQRREDLGALVAATSRSSSLSAVAAEVVLEPPRSTGDLAGRPHIDDDWLTIATVHAVKGMEFDVVHLAHVADGNFPVDMALKSVDGEEEERRLFYVAVTRARHSLNLYWPQRFHHLPRGNHDRHSWSQPSRFLTGAARSRYVTIDEPAVDAGSATEVNQTAVDLPSHPNLDHLWR